MFSVPNSLSPVPVGRAVPRGQVTALLQDHAGRLWVGLQNSMLLYSEGRVREIRRHDGIPWDWPPASQKIQTITSGSR